ncbi:hypothetical protein [Streptomyces sp. 3N207]|uniref:hypothetical protein n=1 Tax=Streptomyces sp. 3N207 TaxID=3457417 RepID=UPI003FCF44C0
MVAFDVVREDEGAVGIRRGGAVNGGMDAELLRGPRLDRPRTIDPGNSPFLGNVLVELPDVVRGDPALCGLDRGRTGA